MKPLSILGSAIWLMGFAALNTSALAEPKAKAESMGYQCRAAVRAEMKGPDCRMAIPPNPTSHCISLLTPTSRLWTINLMNA